jgi:hypothetical protein
MSLLFVLLFAVFPHVSFAMLLVVVVEVKSFPSFVVFVFIFIVSVVSSHAAEMGRNGLVSVAFALVNKIHISA